MLERPVIFGSLPRWGAVARSLITVAAERWGDKWDFPASLSAEIVGVHVEGEGHFGGEGEVIEDALDVFGESAGVVGAHEKLKAKLAVGAGSGGRVGDAEGDALGESLLDATMDVLERELGEAFMRGSGAEEGGVGEGRIRKLASKLEFLVGKTFVIVVTGELDGGRMGREGLDHHFAFHFTPSRAARDLGQELEGPFAGAEIGDVEGEVGVEDGGEGDVGEVEALGDHLGAEEDVDLAGSEGGEGVLEDVFLARGIGVEAGEAGFGKDLAEDFLDLFGAEPL